MMLSIQQVAAQYSVNERTIRRYIAKGMLTAHRIGPKLIRLDSDEVREKLLGVPA